MAYPSCPCQGATKTSSLSSQAPAQTPLWRADTAMHERLAGCLVRSCSTTSGSPLATSVIARTPSLLAESSCDPS